MIGDLLLLFLALGGLALSLTRPGWSDLTLIFGPMTLAILLVFLVRAFRQRRPVPRHVVVDGSNLIYWKDGPPSLLPVKAALQVLQSRGFRPGVIFDANVGYKIGARYQDDRHLARQLNLPADRVLVMPKGVPADEYILKAARDLGAPVVSNDRYRDWAAAFPEVVEPGKLIRGGWRNDDVWLENER